MEFRVVDKGETVSFRELAGGIPIQVGIYNGYQWDPITAVQKAFGKDFDVDFIFALCGGSNDPALSTLQSPENIVDWQDAHHRWPYGADPRSACVTRGVDNTTGRGEGDDEQSRILFNKLTAYPQINRIVSYVHIFGGLQRTYKGSDGKQKHQTFSDCNVKVRMISLECPRS